MCRHRGGQTSPSAESVAFLYGGCLRRDGRAIENTLLLVLSTVKHVSQRISVRRESTGHRIVRGRHCSGYCTPSTESVALLLGSGLRRDGLACLMALGVEYLAIHKIGEGIGAFGQSLLVFLFGDNGQFGGSIGGDSKIGLVGREITCAVVCYKIIAFAHKTEFTGSRHSEHTHAGRVVGGDGVLRLRTTVVTEKHTLHLIATQGRGRRGGQVKSIAGGGSRGTFNKHRSQRRHNILHLREDSKVTINLRDNIGFHPGGVETERESGIEGVVVLAARLYVRSDAKVGVARRRDSIDVPVAVGRVAACTQSASIDR